MAEPIDLVQQALNALADAGLGNDSPAEAFVIGYQAGWPIPRRSHVPFGSGERQTVHAAEKRPSAGQTVGRAETVETGDSRIQTHLEYAIQPAQT